MRATFAWLAAAFPSVAQQPTFSTTVENVRVDVLVTQNGQPVRGLGPDDFEVLDNGVPQQVDLASFEQIPLNVIVVLDMSDSVAGERLDHLRAAGRTVIDALTKEDQTALVTFSHRVTLGSRLTSDFAQVRAALERVQPAGSTSLIDASYTGMMLAESDVGRALVILFTDGIDTSSWLTPQAVLDSAKRSDAVVYAVSAGGTPEFLRDLTSQTGGSLWQIESTKNLSATFLKILEEFRQRYLVSYAPRGVSRDGWHRLDVRIKGRRATVKARPGYQAGS